jgi:DNA-binding MarR family transcriptional regulator
MPASDRNGATPDEVGDGAALLAVVRAIRASTDGYRRVVAARFGLGAADLAALSLLQRQEPQRAGQIGEWTGLTPGSVTALLDRLEARGLLTRIRPAHDRRSVEVGLTPEGRALGDAVIDGLLPAMDRVAAEIGPDGCRLVVAALRTVNAALDGLSADPRLPDTRPG